jgi:hypothetical protein
MTQLPFNANRLIAMRKRRSAPALPVLASLVGPLEFSNFTLLAQAGGAYDWHCIAGLEVEVFVSHEVAFANVLRHLADIAAAVPKRMVLTFIDGPRIECGEWRTVPHPEGDFALFDWFPIGIGPRYGQSQPIVRRLFAELGKALPIPFDRAMGLVLEVAQEAVCA